ncbi:MAG: Uma2 family endonuclease [Selenomonadaceae bacterium]|nr:Uma2 family endonuclease [Selenomonadaceae bacterium]
MSVSDVRNDYEIIEGVKFMSPSPDMGHGTITSNLIATIGSYVKINKLGICFGDHMDVHFPDGNVFQPDFIFVSSAKAELFLDKRKFTFHGVPDMVAEIFSKSTMKRDLGIKKDVYERNGVREYWIIDPWRETIDVYLLRDDKYELDGHYENWSDDELAERAELPEEERPEVKPEVPVAVLDGFTVKIRNIFGWYFE